MGARGLRPRDPGSAAPPARGHEVERADAKLLLTEISAKRLLADPVGGTIAQLLEAPPGFEPGIRVLQTLALPLGHDAIWQTRAGDGIRTHDLLLGKETYYHCTTPAEMAPVIALAASETATPSASNTNESSTGF